MASISLISVIDDDPSMLSATESLLRSHGFVTEGFGSADAFLASGDPARFECIITDVQMPGISGIELIAVLAGRKHRVPTILMTARSEHELIARATRSGAVSLLRKPFSAEALLECLRHALPLD